MSKNVLITGGAGFIGSHLVDSYCADGHNVVVVDNMYSGRWENIDRWLKSKYNEKTFCFHRLDLLYDDIKPLLRQHKIEVIHHLAARPRVKYSVDNPVTSNEHNVTATLRVLEAAREMKIGRVVYSASSSAYGNVQEFPTAEHCRPHPLSPYALQKYVGEEYCRLFYELYGLDTISLRYFNVFGPRSLADSQYSAVIPIFIEQIFSGKPVTIDGDGTQSRDFTYVDNVVHANRLAAACPTPLQGRMCNVACGDNISINDLTNKLIEMIGRKVEIQHNAPRPGDAYKTQAAIGLAKELIGFEPVMGFEEGLRKTVKWYLCRLTFGPQEV